MTMRAAIRVIWASPRFGHPQSQNPKDMGIPYNPIPNPKPYEKGMPISLEFCSTPPPFPFPPLGSLSSPIYAVHPGFFAFSPHYGAWFQATYTSPCYLAEYHLFLIFSLPKGSYKENLGSIW